MVRKCHHSKEFITVSVKHGAFTAFYGKPLQTLLETTPLLKSPFYVGLLCHQSQVMAWTNSSCALEGWHGDAFLSQTM